MAAPKGNQFWKLRSKHGRDKLFASPDLLWEAACEYFQWCDDTPLIEVDFRGKDADRVQIPKMRSYTLQGLCLYLDCNTQYFKTFKSQLKDDSEGFNTVITRIEETIYNQKFTGAASGFLNPSIIARDLGLADKVESKQELKAEVKTEAKLDISKLSLEEKKALRELQRKMGVVEDGSSSSNS